jgi:transposase
MPKKIKLEAHLGTEELENRYRKAKDPVLRSHYQILWLIAAGKTTGEVMEVTGYCRDWIQKVARRYNRAGAQALGDRRHDNPGAKQRALLTEEHQRELAEALREPPSDGGMWNSRKVAEWIKAKSGKAASRQRGWEYLRRLGHSPKVPRPVHKEADRHAQEAFKKDSR